MGVVYKLSKEIKSFIIEQKEAAPSLSCRALSEIVFTKFQVKVSKSSINFIVKNMGLSMPVGRRQIKKRRKPKEPVIPIESKVKLSLRLAAKTLLLGQQVPVEKPAERVIEKPLETSSAIPLGQPQEQAVISPNQPLPLEVPEPAPAPEMPEPAEPAQLPVSQPLSTQPTKEPVQETVPVKQKEPLEPAPVEKPVDEQLFEIPNSGLILLRVADALIGGSYHIAESIAPKLNVQIHSLISKIECLLYSQFAGDSALWKEKSAAYLQEFQSVTNLSSDVFKAVSSASQEVRYVNITLSNNTSIYLDGQLHTIWSTPNVPYDFSSTIYNIKGYVAEYFQDNTPFMFFIPPGYDTPTEEFFNFLLCMDQCRPEISRLTLCGNKFEQLEDIYLDKEKRRFFIFGLWPWQFVDYRKVNRIGESKAICAGPAKKGLFAAEVEIELLQPNSGHRVTLTGCAIKTNPSEKTRLIILSNLSSDALSPEKLADAYLSHWPNLEEAFKDYSHKIEVFTYTGDSGHIFSSQVIRLLIDMESAQDAGSLLNCYLKILDLYVRWYFLPSGYKEKDFQEMSKHFYSLEISFREENNNIFVMFKPPDDFAFISDLYYACRRINEREVILPSGKRLVCVI